MGLEQHGPVILGLRARAFNNIDYYPRFFKCLWLGGRACLKAKVAVPGAGTAGITAAINVLFLASRLTE